MATGRRPPSGPDIPDLDAPRARASGAPQIRTSAAPAPRVSAPPSPSSAPRSAQDYFGSGNFDSEGGEEANVSIALDTGDAPAVSKDPSAYFGGGGALRAEEATGATDGDLDFYEGSTANAQAMQVAPVAPVDRKKWPTGSSPDTAPLRIDSVEITVAADYGAAPSSIVLTPIYAVRVLVRKRALQAKVKELSTSLTEATKKRDELLVLLVQDLRGKILMVEEGATLFEPIVAIERVALERRSALAGTSAEYDARTADLAERTRVVQREAEEQRAVVLQCSAALEGVVRSFERADAKKKRLYIELSGLVRIAEKAGGVLSPEQTASVARLEGTIAAQKPELDAAAAAVEASRARLAGAEAEERKIAARGRDVERIRRALDQEFQKQMGARNEGVAESEQQRQDAFAVLGRTVLAAKGRLVDVRAEVLDAIGRADQVELGRATELEKYLRARDAYDADALKKGVAIIGLVALVLVVGIIVLATR